MTNTEHQRDLVSKALINENGAARYVVRAENHRAKQLLDEQYIDPYAGEPRLVGLGRTLLAKTGLYHPKSPQLVERPYLEADQQRQSEAIAGELNHSRELIRDNTIAGIDDVAVDARLGLRADDCILPPLFRELHRRTEAETGQVITFLTWMTDHATDEQLVNVWQWHDKYLSDLDNDPAFQERLTSIKAGYIEGSRQAIADGVLHPDMAVQGSKMDDIRVIHGSPFSPLMAIADAYADRKANTVELHEGASDFTLYHEITHLLNGGMHFEFDEGVTDLVAAELYNRSHPQEAQVDPRSSVYGDQIATLDAMNRMSDGKASLYELSHAYAGVDGSQNTLLFATRVDAAIGLPITISMLNSSKELIEKGMTVHDGGVVRLASQMVMRRQAEFLAAMMFDDDGHRVAVTTQELAKRMLSADSARRYGQDVILDGLNILMDAHKIQEALEDS